MNKLYESKDLLALGDAVFSCDINGDYSPTELDHKVKFLLTYNDAENNNDALILKNAYDAFMVKYHRGDEWNHKLVRNVCDKSLRSFLDNTYDKKIASQHLNTLTKAKSTHNSTILPW